MDTMKVFSPYVLAQMETYWQVEVQIQQLKSGI
jgi:hypothetical protein